MWSHLASRSTESAVFAEARVLLPPLANRSNSGNDQTGDVWLGTVQLQAPLLLISIVAW